MSKLGVFIRSAQDDVLIVEKCTELLQILNLDMKILHIARDRARNGLRVVFDSDLGVLQLLQTRYLGDDPTSTIHALTTALVIQQAFPSDEEDFKEKVRNQFGNLFPQVKVLEIRKVPLSAKFPDIGTGNWIVILDVPEVEDSEEFVAKGLPNSMEIKLPQHDAKFKVKFYCRLCTKDGHTQNRCKGSTKGPAGISKNVFPKTPTKTVTSSGPSSSTPSPNHSKNPFMKWERPSSPKSFQPGRFRIRDKEEERKEMIPKSSKLQQYIDDAKFRFGQEEVRNALLLVKKEKEELIPSEPIDFRSDAYPTPSSTNNDVEIVFDSVSSGPDPVQNFVDNLVSTSNPLFLKRPLDDDVEYSNTPPQKRTLKLLPVNIPPGIRHIISGIPDSVLDVQQLEAFFNHAKKKSRLAEIAEKYTSDVEGLKRQLVAISRRYYMSTNVGPNADVQFMKMLQNLLKRFENGPAPKKGGSGPSPAHGSQVM